MLTAESAVRTVRHSDTLSVARILAGAFQNDPVSAYAVPDRFQRPRAHGIMFRTFVEWTVEQGQAYAIGNKAAALFIPSTARLTPAFEAGMDRLQTTYPRFADVFELLEDNEPRNLGPFSHLLFVGVSKDLRGQGAGRRLLAHHLSALTVPAYLEATTPDSTRLYKEHLGFETIGTLKLPDDTVINQMWREPTPLAS